MMRHLYSSTLLLVLHDSAHRAYVGASTAFDAHVSSDAVDIPCGDSSNSAFVDTSAASSAVFSNFVSHNVSFIVSLDYTKKSIFSKILPINSIFVDK